MADEGDDAVASNNEGGNQCGNYDSSSGESRSAGVSSSEGEEGDRNIEEQEEVEEEDDKEYHHHASMTVPCALFPSAKKAKFIMTVSALQYCYWKLE